MAEDINLDLVDTTPINLTIKDDPELSLTLQDTQAISLSLTASAASNLIIEETDGSPSVQYVNKIKFPNGSVTDNGDNSVTVTAAGNVSYTSGGPSVADNSIVRFDGTTGTIIQGATNGPTIDDSGNITVGGNISVVGTTYLIGAVTMVTDLDVGGLTLGTQPASGGSGLITAKDTNDSVYIKGDGTGYVYLDKTIVTNQLYFGNVGGDFNAGLRLANLSGTFEGTIDNYGAGSMYWDTANDRVRIYDGTSWSTLGGGASVLDDLNDVTITSVGSGEILRYNGSEWVNNTLSEAGVAPATHTHTLSQITDVTATASEVNLLDGATATNGLVLYGNGTTFAQESAFSYDSSTNTFQVGTTSEAGDIWAHGALQVGLTSKVQLKNSSGELQIRNNADSDFADLRAEKIQAVVYSNESVVTFTNADATPTIAGGNVFLTANTSATTITNFDNAIDGQKITIVFGDGNTTLTHGSNIKLTNGGNWTFSTDDAVTLVSSGGVWYEVGRAGGGSGSISGPGSSTDNAVVRWNGAGGNAIQSSSVIIDDSDNITGVNSLSVTDDAFSSAWNGSLEVPTKNAIYDKINALETGLDWQDSVLDIQTDATLDPGASPTTGDRYILTDTASLHANFGSPAGVGNNDIVEYDGSNFVVVYDASVETEGGSVWDEDSNNYYVYNGTAWVKWNTTLYTASDGIQLDGANIELDINSLTEISSVTATEDFLVVYDGGSGDYKKIDPFNVVSAGRSSFNDGDILFVDSAQTSGENAVAGWAFDNASNRLFLSRQDATAGIISGQFNIEYNTASYKGIALKQNGTQTHDFLYGESSGGSELFSVSALGGAYFGDSINVLGTVQGDEIQWDNGTEGSVLFLNGSKQIDEDNSNFFWDNTNKRLGIGEGTPTSFLHIAGASSGGGGTAHILLDKTDDSYSNLFTSQPFVNSDTLVFMTQAGSNGGFDWSGFSNSGAESGIYISGHTGASPSVPAIKMRAWKHDGSTDRTAYTGTEQVIGFYAGNTQVSYIDASGNIQADAYTQGSVLFAGASGVISQNNSKFYWDDANENLGIGAAPNSETDLHVQRNGAALLRVETTDASERAFLQVRNTDTESWEFNLWGPSKAGTLFGINRANLAECISDTNAVLGTLSGKFLAFGSGGNEAARFSSDGDFSIGQTSNTEGKVQIYANADTFDAVGHDSAYPLVMQSDYATGGVLLKGRSAGSDLAFEIVETNDIDNSAHIWMGSFPNGSFGPSGTCGIVSDKNGTGTVRNLILTANDSPVSATPQVTIKAGSAMVGINQANPAYALDIVGDINEASNFRWDSTNEVLVIGDSGGGYDSEPTMEAFRNDTDVLGATNNSGVVIALSNQSTGDAFLKTAGSGGGDSGILIESSNGVGWAIGQDNSDGDKLKINNATNSLTSAVAVVFDGVTSATFTGDVIVPDEAYGVSWNGSLEVPTKNAIYDKIETIGSQNLFETVAGDTGTNAVADSATDTLTIAGGTGIDTSGDSATDTITVTLNASINDLSDVSVSSPSENDVLVYDSGNWTNVEVVPNADRTQFNVRNETGSTITAGTPVYVSGFSGAQDRPLVAVADASSGSTMPAIGVIKADIANNTNGYCVSLGSVTNINTSACSVGDTIYVANGGGFTKTKPTGTNLIQNIGKVLKVHATTGSIEVMGAGRSNDVPNIASANFWIGNASGVATAVTMSGDATIDNTGAVTISSERVQDIAGQMFSGNTETLITATYQDADGTIDLVVDNDLSNYSNATSGFITASSTDTLTNKSGNISQWTNDSGYITATLTQEQVEDYAGALVANATGTHTGITITYQDATGDMDFVVDHDATLNFVANEHIDHTSVTFTAGDGLSGGGDISANRTFNVDISPQTDIGTPASGDLLLIEDITDGSIKKVQIGNLPTGGGGEANTASNVGTAGVGMFKQKTGVDLEFKKLNAGSSKVTITDDTGNSEVDVDIVEANINHDSLSGFVANEHIDWTGASAGTIHVTNIQSASTTQSGVQENATSSEINVGTSTTLTVTPDALAGSYAGTKTVQMVITDFTTDVATGDGKFYFEVPDELGGMNLIRARGRVVTAGTTGSTDIQIHNITQVADMLTGKISIASAGTSAEGTIDTANDDVATDDVLRIDVDAVSTTAPKGLIITLAFRLP